MPAVLLLLWSFITCTCLPAQKNNLSFKQVQDEVGIPSSEQQFIFRDSKSLIWLGTDDGLYRYDGQEFKLFKHDLEQRYSLPENRINSSFFEDDAGNIWFSTFHTLVCYRPRQNVFIPYTIPDLSANNYRPFHLEDGKIWLSIHGDGGVKLWHFEIKTAQFIPSVSLNGSHQKFHFDPSSQTQQIISFDLDHSGLIITDLPKGSSSKVDFTQRISSSSSRFESNTKAVFIDPSGNIWVGLYNALGLLKAGEIQTAKGWVVDERVKAVELDFGYINAITSQPGSNHLYLATERGVIVFDTQSMRFVQQYAMDTNGISSIDFNMLIIDEQELLWAIGPASELYYADISYPLLYNKQSRPQAHIKHIGINPNQEIWASSLANGVFVYDYAGDSIHHIQLLNNATQPERSFPMPYLTAFTTDQQQEWWGVLENNFFLWREKEEIFDFDWPYYLSFNMDYTARATILLKRKRGDHLVVKANEIFRLQLSNEGVDTSKWHDLQHLNLGNIKFMAENSLEQLFIADQTGKLILLEEHLGTVSQLNEANNLGVVHAIKEDTSRHLTWIASSTGLWQMNPDNFSLNPCTYRTHGLTKRPYYDILIDLQNQLWLPSNNGLIFYQPTIKKEQKFTTQEGLFTNSFHANASLVHPRTGQIWLGSKSGLNVFDPLKINRSSFQPPIRIIDFLVNDESYLLTKNKHIRDSIFNINYRDHIEFNHGENTLSFQFTAVDHLQSELTEYTYQMEGIDQERVSNGTRNFVRYPNLPAGTYNFKIWATNADGVPNPTPKTLGITIIPPIYQRWWFYLLCLLAICGIIYSIFKYRLEQALKMERLRVKISSDLHDDVGGMLSGLAMQTELLEITASEDRKPKLQQVAEISRAAMSRMRDTVWAIDARKDRVENLIDRMHEHAEETLTPKDITYHIELENLDPKAKLPTDIRQNLYLIYKEAITNVAKHSNADRVSVLLSQGPHNFNFRIQDNGHVSQKNYKTTGVGMDNLDMRAKLIGATLSIQLENGFAVIVTKQGKLT